MKRLILLAVIPLSLTSFGQDSKDSPTIIRSVLDRQVAAWNEGNIEKFMDGYWKSDSVQFIGSQMTMGWKNTLEGYKKRYPDRESMGTLRFELLQLQPLAPDAYLVTGKYFLIRKKDNPQGIFTLLFRKKKGKWVVVYDHTS